MAAASPSEKTTGRDKAVRLAARVVLGVVTALAALALLELAAVAVELAAYGVTKVDGQPRKLYLTNEEQEGGGLVSFGQGPPSGEDAAPGGIIIPRPRLRPGAHLKGLLYEIHVSSLGTRGAELLDPKPPDGLRVLCMGGSSTFDIYAPDDASTWPGRLVAALARRLPGRTVEAINAGVPGEILQGNAMDLVNLHTVAQPDVVVLYQGPNEIRRSHRTKLPPIRPPPALLSNSSLFQLLSTGVRSLRAPSFDPQGQLEDEELAAARREVESFIDLALARDLTVVLATHAFEASPEPTARELRGMWDTADMWQMSPQRVCEALDSYAAMVRTVARDRGLELADLRAEVPADASYWGDSTHFSAKGSALAGEIVARAVMRSLGLQAAIEPLPSRP